MSFKYTYANQGPQQPVNVVYNSGAYNDYYKNLGNQDMPPSMASYNPKNKKASPPSSYPPPIATPVPKGSRKKRWSGVTKLAIVFIIVVVAVVALAAAGVATIPGFGKEDSNSDSEGTNEGENGGSSGGGTGTTPTPNPTAFPTTVPPTPNPTAFPTTVPPTPNPTAFPTTVPPTPNPTAFPTTVPPTPNPTAFPTTVPPTPNPTAFPTTVPPTPNPTTVPPTPNPTAFPTTVPPTPNPTPFPTTPAPTQGATAPQDTQIENADIRRTSDQLIGLAFFTEMGAQETAAFTNAQARWSRIVGGTLASWPTFAFNAGTDICGSGETTIERISFNFLLILAGITPIDGAFGILGQAGPCRTGRFNNKVFPVAGRMQFDSADIDLMKRDGTLVSVILHEMGHVLGIGTLWGSNGLIQNEVATANINVQPIFTGAEGTRRFDLANDGLVDDGFTNVPVENGFTNGRNNGAGQGSLNGHWDQDGTPGELMVFQIASGAVPPLSAITIGALQDAGYIVDFSEADSFSTARARAEQARLRGSGATVYELKNDIHPYEIKTWDEE